MHSFICCFLCSYFIFYFFYVFNTMPLQLEKSVKLNFIFHEVKQGKRFPARTFVVCLSTVVCQFRNSVGMPPSPSPKPLPSEPWSKVLVLVLFFLTEFCVFCHCHANESSTFSVFYKRIGYLFSFFSKSFQSSRKRTKT